MLSLDSKVKSVFITGGTSGIGLSLAQKYIEMGYFVGVCGRDLDKISDFNHDHLKKYKVDIINAHELDQSVDDFYKAHGLDIMIASAGIGYANKSQLPDFDRSKLIFKTNVEGVLNAFESAMKYMVENKSGQLVAIASVAGFNGLPGVSAYSASKAAVIKICETFTIDLLKFGINVTCINPGFIDTPLTRKNKHPMPFLMDSDIAANLIIKAILKRKVTYSFPFLFAYFVKFLGMIPRSLYVKIMRKDGMNYSVKTTKD